MPTFQPTIFKSTRNRGFTLIEVMIVVAILGAVVAIGVPRLFRKENNLKSTARQFIVISKEIRNRARLSGNTYRLAVELGKPEGGYWVERGSLTASISKAYLELEQKKETSGSTTDDENAKPSLFQKDTSVIKADKKLPAGMAFKSLETMNTESPLTEGVGYIHFLPEGFVEAASLQINVIEDANKIWSLLFNPMTGRADIVEKAINLKEAQQ